MSANSHPISPDAVTKLDPSILPANLSNGMIGLRVRQIPFQVGTAVVNGLDGIEPAMQFPGSPFAPYPLAGDVGINDAFVSQAPQNIRFESQYYDFENGELTTKFSFISRDVTASITVLTFCSRTSPTVVVQRTTISVDTKCNVSLRAIIDPNTCAGNWKSRHTKISGVNESIPAGAYWATPNLSGAKPEPGKEKFFIDGSLEWELPGGLTTCGIAYATGLKGEDDPEVEFAELGDNLPLVSQYSFQARAGKNYVFEQFVSMVPSCYIHQPESKAVSLVYVAKEKGFDALQEENRSCWREIWRGRIQLIGAPKKWQALADAAHFYLQTSLHHASPTSTTPFGLSRWPNYNYYYGHIMWDLDIFSVPPLLLTAPDSARSVLEYRFERLEAARKNAKLHGLKGAQFPWESSALFGEEAASLISPNCINELHVSLDVAFGFLQYYFATNDREFLREKAWPVLREVSAWIASRVTKTERGYEFLGGVGIDEAVRLVNNDAYTIIAAKTILQGTILAATVLERQVRPEWEEIAKNLCLPFNKKSQVIQMFDGYRPDQSQAPAVLAGFFPYPYRPGGEIEKATIDFYLPLVKKYLGTPMLSSIVGVYAAWRGDRKLSLELFEKGYADFIVEPFTITNEIVGKEMYGHPIGPFIANLGGFLMGCLLGLTGINLGPGDPESWCERKICLPEGWDGIEVERVWIHGKPAKLSAHHGDDKASITFL